MSWSISKTGDAHELIPVIKKDLIYKMVQPEEHVRDKAIELIVTALITQTGNVIVNASGHQSKDFTTGKVNNTLRIEIIPQ